MEIEWSKQIALVTGANRGIGLEVCRQLAAKGLQVVLTSRDVEQGNLAVEMLLKQGLRVDYHPLDVSKLDSVQLLYEYVLNTYGRLDVLVNNAGIYLDEDQSVFEVSLETLRKTLDTNFFGVFYMCRAFIPLMLKHNYGRVVNVSSGMGALQDMRGRHTAYRLSKTALNALTRVLAGETRQANIKVNSVCPGWVRTDMGGPQAERDVAQGAETLVWLAMLPDDGPSGGFFRDRKPIDW